MWANATACSSFNVLLKRVREELGEVFFYCLGVRRGLRDVMGGKGPFKVGVGFVVLYLLLFMELGRF